MLALILRESLEPLDDSARTVILTYAVHAESYNTIYIYLINETIIILTKYKLT